jgi:hypothetical protein
MKKRSRIREDKSVGVRVTTREDSRKILTSCDFKKEDPFVSLVTPLFFKKKSYTRTKTQYETVQL